MKILAIEQSNNENNSIDVLITIENNFPLIFNFKGADNLPLLNDCVFLSLYLQSMQDGTDLQLPNDYPVSKTLVENLFEHQRIFTRWFPDELLPININVNAVDRSFTPKGKVSLFSGGVDSFYTYVLTEQSLSHVFLCIGLDIQLEEVDKVEAAIELYSDFACRNGKQLLIVTTNIRHVFPNGNRSIQHAALLTAMVLAFGLEFLYIPASHNIDELFPWGSHLLTDPLLSNGITQVLHHGAVSRSEKTMTIAENQNALDSIRICNSSEEFNCGECEKCLRTMFVLEILGKQTKNLPLLTNKLSLLKGIKIYKESQATFWLDNYKFAIKHQRPDLAKYAHDIVRNYRWRQWLKQGVALIRYRLTTSTKC
ncbi:hypothetical protein [Thalassotalea sp. G2M2-11]|uniref:hypothetical protein n=1 Tax=Thalassotalea sp. G2M2-11 TaxID=2787627 RepID=UPI0019D13AAE|nr:hypothetical protein [Thalassotalea sp. G2M2-11]